MFTFVIAAVSPAVESTVCVVMLCKLVWAALAKMYVLIIELNSSNAAFVCASLPDMFELVPS